ncbi:MAG: phosphatase PAP2 family protein [Bradymonadaceae bacterium]
MQSPHSRRLLPFLLLVFLLAAPPVQAQETLQTPDLLAPSPKLEVVPIGTNFSPVDLAMLGVMYPTSMVLVLHGGSILPQPHPSIGPPSPESLDYRISERTHGNLETGAPWLRGVPDKTAYVLGVLPAAYYATSSVYRWLAGESLLGFQGPHLHHSTLAFAKAYALTAVTSVGVKFLVGRPRPYVALDRPAYGWKPEEENLAFFSGHASSSFAAASFLYLDISDGLYHRLLVDWEPVPRFLMGRALPFTVLYGSATAVAYSRIYDQKHYFSDVLIGGLVGTLIGNLVYVVHFDSDGHPRKRRTPRGEGVASTTAFNFSPALLTTPSESAMGWSLSLTW